MALVVEEEGKATDGAAGESRPKAAFWAIMGVGVTLTAIGITVTLGSNAHTRLDTRLAALEKGQAHIAR